MEKVKSFNGKAIYQPKGAAQEYSKWACNFYVGCSNNCSYCYLKKGIGCKTLGGSVPTLKKCFKDKTHIEAIFTKEFFENIEELKKHGLFFSFTTDPCLHVTIDQTIYATRLCVNNGVPVKILTKKADILLKNIERFWFYSKKTDALNLIAFGFTLTGRDDLEPGASTNQERIEAMQKLHYAGFKTWASIEPIIDFESSYRMIYNSIEFCNLYKIGLMSGKKYDVLEIKNFILNVNSYYSYFPAKIYWKDSLLKQAGIDRADLPSNCVSSDFNLFNS